MLGLNRGVLATVTARRVTVRGVTALTSLARAGSSGLGPFTAKGGLVVAQPSPSGTVDPVTLHLPATLVGTLRYPTRVLTIVSKASAAIDVSAIQRAAALLAIVELGEPTWAAIRPSLIVTGRARCLSISREKASGREALCAGEDAVATQVMHPTGGLVTTAAGTERCSNLSPWSQRSTA